MSRQLELIIGLTQADALQSSYQTNWYYKVNRTGSGFDIVTDISLVSRHFDDCNCRISSNCVQLSTMRNRNGTILLTIPGFYIGCLPTQALIQSTMECFYNRFCIDQIQSHIGYNQFTLHVTPLNLSNSSRYSPETPIEDMLKQMFVEEWDSQTNYEQYYEQCKPTYCQYQFIQQYSASSVIKLAGLLSTLNLIFRLITPALFYISLYTYRRLKSRNIIIPQEDTLSQHDYHIQ